MADAVAVALKRRPHVIFRLWPQAPARVGALRSLRCQSFPFTGFQLFANDQMAAACRGAKKVPGSLTVGILPVDSSPVSPQVDVAIFTGMGMARNAVNVLSSDVVVACGAGGAGTASEVAFAPKAGKPLVLLRPTPAAVAFHESLGTGFFVASTPEEAVALIESRRLTDLRAPPPC